MIVGLGHEMQVGKDTAAQWLVDNLGFVRMAFADKLKLVALDANPIVELDEDGVSEMPLRLADVVTMVGWEQAKELPLARSFLQNLGVAARRHIGPNIWVDPVITEAWAASMAGGRVVITDVRFPNEFNSINVSGGHLIKLTRPGVAQNKNDRHESETALTGYPWHHVISNHGTVEELGKGIQHVLGL